MGPSALFCRALLFLVFTGPGVFAMDGLFPTAGADRAPSGPGTTARDGANVPKVPLQRSSHR